MRALAVIAVIAVLAACGGGTAKPAPPRDEAKAKIERDVAAITAAADRACACTDAACTAALDAELADEFRTMDVRVLREDSSTGPSEQQKTQAQADLKRLLACVTQHGTVAYAYGIIAARTFESVKDEACQCQDAACARAANTAWGMAHESVGAFPVDDETMTELNATVAAATRCFDASVAMRLEDAMREVRAIRDAACACKDAECGTRSLAEMRAWAERHKMMPEPDQTTADEMAEIGRQIGLCTNTASQEAVERALDEMAVLRDRACACTSSTCADGVQAEFDEFLMTYRDVHGTQDQAKQIGELASELSTCLAKHQGASTP